jgi:hypothetical protein
MSEGKIPQPAEISAENIIRPSFDDLSAEQHEAYEALKKQRQEKRQEEFMAQQKKREEEDMEAYLANFKKERQGSAIQLGEINLPPVLCKSAESSVSKSLFTPDQLAEIQGLVNCGNEQVYNVLLEMDSARKNIPPPKPSVSYVPIDSSHIQGAQLVAAPEYHTPIRSIPYSATLPNSGVRFSNSGAVPNIGSAPVANPPLVRPSTLEETLAKFREDLDQSFFEKYGFKAASRVYHKPYPEYFDALPYPQGYKVPDFAKFNGVDSKTTWKHVSQYLAQLGEAGNSDPLKVRLFPLSLTGTAFSWFSALPYGSINTWYHLEKKFHEHFYSGDNELKLSHLTSLKQKHDESVTDYIKRFSDTKNRCYSLVITERHGRFRAQWFKSSH